MQIRSILVPLALVLVFACGCRKDPNVAKHQYLQSGQRFLEQGKYQQAEIQFRNALKIDPRFAEAYLQLSKPAIATARWQEARGDLERALQLDPNLTEARLAVSRLYLSASQFDRAEEEAQTVLRREPANVEALDLLGSVYLNSGRDAEARDAFAHCIKLAPNKASGYINLGVMELSLHNLAEAERNLLQAERIDPKMPVVYADLANLYRIRQRLPDAERILRQGISNVPEAYPLDVLLAEILVEESRPADAEAELQKLLSRDGNKPEAAAGIGDLYAGLGQSEFALAAYQRGLSAAPKNIELEDRIVAVYISGNRIAEARSLNDAVIRESPANPTANVQRAQILMAQNHLDESVQILQRQVANSPDFDLAHLVLGTALWRLGAVEQARNAYQDAVRISPGMVEAWKPLTELLLSRGETNAARIYAQRCIQLEPGAAAGHLLMGAAHLQSHDYPGAHEEFAAAQRLSPRDPWPHVRMANAWAAEKHRAEAEREFQLALALQPDNASLFGEYFEFLLTGPEAVQAISDARQFAAAHPSSAEAQNLLASVCIRRQLYAEAVEAAQHAITIDPRLLSAYLTLGSVQERFKQTDSALATYTRALSIQPKYPPLLTLIGNLYLEKNNLDLAGRYFEQALTIDPNFAIAEANLAWVYAARGEKLNVALGLAQKAKRQMPSLDSITDTLGWVEYKKGDYVAAKLLLQDCVQVAPQQANYHYHLGMALLGAGDRKRGRAELESALRLKLSGDSGRDAREVLGKMH